ncbi:OmpA/MotB family protein [Yunchengibacter salinarum]|uniref:OmpA/MotB family protein n=1 Tax=Yunchengibacter salinarum TaxID=3133399 RepID=UPI0035B62C4C
MTQQSRSPFEQGKERPSQQTPWMITFADLLSLLLAFFVLLFSMGRIEPEAWTSMVDSMARQFRAEERTVPKDTETVSRDSEPAAVRPAENLDYLRGVLEAALQGDPVLETAVIHKSSGRLVISIPAEILFFEKRATLTDGARPALAQLAAGLGRIDNRIMVAGLSNAAPVRNRYFDNNWSLSLTRARLVAGILNDRGYPRKISVLGYGDSRVDQLPADVVSRSPFGLNARLDIILLDEGNGDSLHGLF